MAQAHKQVLAQVAASNGCKAEDADEHYPKRGQVALGSLFGRGANSD